jgi:hypothetical protein
MWVKVFVALIFVCFVSACRTGDVSQNPSPGSNDEANEWVVFAVDYGPVAVVRPTLFFRHYDIKTGELLDSQYVSGGRKRANYSDFFVLNLKPGDYFLEKIRIEESKRIRRTLFDSKAPKFRVESRKATYLGSLAYSKRLGGAPKISLRNLGNSAHLAKAQEALNSRVESAPKLTVAKPGFVKLSCDNGVLGLAATCKVQ